MKIIPKYDIGSAIQFYVPGQIRRGILTSDPKGNNIYYNQDWNGYNNWHSKNIVLKGYNTIQNPENIEWEDYLKKGMDSWNNAGGFDWLYSNDPNYRQHRLQSTGTKSHQDLIIKEYDWLNNAIGDKDNYTRYNIPSKAFTADKFENGKLVGRSGVRSDNDFGVQTGNRRPTIHVNTGLAATRDWDDYFKNLGYVGAYEYLDHWIPTKDPNKATRKFGSVVEQFGVKDPGQIENPQKVVKEDEGELPEGQKEDPESLWNKLSRGFNNIAPDLLDSIRLAGNMINNQRVYDESMKAIIPNLQQSYHTYRQVTGDEATKQGYYRRAVQGEQKAARPFTSDADRQVAYMNEAKRIGDELRAQGDLADNQRIRETSAESATHLDSNRERDTTIANANITELNKAAAAKHQLTAQKHSADWTNLEQYLMGKQYKLEKEKAERKQLSDKIWLLNEQNKLENDPDYISLQKAVDEAWDKAEKSGKTPQNDENVKKAIQNLRNWKTRREITMLESRPISAKQGTKIERKYKDDSNKYLYKISKDIVEHFRRMSKMTDDSRIKTLPKAIRLPSHPKKMQLGGVAPFTIYRPLGLGGESAVSSQTISSGNGKSEKDNSSKDKLDMIKELFKAIQGQGLPIDVSMAYREISNVFNKAKALGEEMSTDDIASMYLKSMDTISRLKYSKEVYDKAKAVATQKESLDEFAVDALGNYVVQDQDNNITTVKSLEDIREQGLNPITNQQLLNLRAYSPNLALQHGDYFVDNIINNGMGINKIGAQIRALAGNIGSTENKLDGLTQVESNKVKSGLQILANAPDGYYKHTVETKSQQEQVRAALSYIENMLSPSQKAILNIHGGVKENIARFLNSQMDFSTSTSIQPLSGKASDKEGKDSMDNLKINEAVRMLLGMSSPREFTFSIGNGNAFTGAARVAGITKNNGSTSLGADFSYSEIYSSDLNRNLDLDNACFGDVPINKALKDRIIVDNSTIAGVDLPYTTDRNGRIIPDFQLLNRIEEADKEVLQAGIDPNKNPEKVNEIYAKHNLPIKYGANNQLTGKYKRFAVIQATAVEDVFLNKDGLSSNGTLTLVSDEDEINKYIEEMEKVPGKIDMDKGWFTGKKDIYKGSIFIPIIGDLVDAVSSTGNLTAGNYNDLRNKWQTKNYVEVPQQYVKQ